MPENTEATDEVFYRIGRPALSALLAEGYTNLQQLTALTEKELLKLHGVGPRAVHILREEMALRGM